MNAQWRHEIPEGVRKDMINDIYVELLRISGEKDKRKVWGTAAKFEHALWSKSADRKTYLTKMQRRIFSLKRKTEAGQQAHSKSAYPQHAFTHSTVCMTTTDAGVVASAAPLNYATTDSPLPSFCEATNTQWREEIPENVRTNMIRELCTELHRISGDNDREKVWGSAAKFEFMLWSNSVDRSMYMAKMQRKIKNLKRRPGYIQ